MSGRQLWSRAFVGMDEQSKQVTNGPLPQKGFRQRPIDLDPVMVATPVSVLEHVASLDEVGDNAERGTFGDVEGAGDLAQPRPRVVGDAQQRPRVIGQETPSHERYLDL